MSAAELLEDPNVALIFAVVFELTGEVLIAKFAEVWPCGTVTEAGTAAAPLLLPSDTLTPPEPAGEDSVTVPVDPDPPVTEVGFTETALMFVAWLIVRPAFTVFAETAVRIAEVVLPTVAVLTVKLPEV